MEIRFLSSTRIRLVPPSVTGAGVSEAVGASEAAGVSEAGVEGVTEAGVGGAEGAEGVSEAGADSPPVTDFFTLRLRSFLSCPPDKSAAADPVRVIRLTEGSGGEEGEDDMKSQLATVLMIGKIIPLKHRLRWKHKA